MAEHDDARQASRQSARTCGALTRVRRACWWRAQQAVPTSTDPMGILKNTREFKAPGAGKEHTSEVRGVKFQILDVPREFSSRQFHSQVFLWIQRRHNVETHKTSGETSETPPLRRPSWLRQHGCAVDDGYICLIASIFVQHVSTSRKRHLGRDRL